MKSNQENIFCDDLVKLFKKDLDFAKIPALLKNLEIRIHEKILYDVTILYGGAGKFTPKFGFLEQDIVIGKSLKVSNQLGVFFYRAKTRTEVFEPEVVIEVKYGNVTSHQLITYSHIASKIKSVFPRCRYYLVLGYCSVSIFEKVMRHGTFFDRIFSLSARLKGQTKILGYFKGKIIKDGVNKRNVYRKLIQNIKNDLCSIKITR